MNMKKTSALLGPFSRKVPAILMIVALVAGCNSGVNGNGDAGSDALLPDSDIPDYFGEWDTVILDGSDGEEHVCPEPCGPAGSRQCNGDVIEVCTADAFACMVWQVLQNCADTGQVCDDTGDIPVCVTPELLLSHCVSRHTGMPCIAPMSSPRSGSQCWVSRSSVMVTPGGGTWMPLSSTISVRSSGGVKMPLR